MILIDLGFARYTPDNNTESASNFHKLNQPVSFKMLVDLMSGYHEASSSSGFTSLMSYDRNRQTGAEIIRHLHYSPKNPARYKKYWQLALGVAGFV